MNLVKCPCPCHKGHTIKHFRPCCNAGYVRVPDIKDALLVSYVVYDHPSDFPNLFVVRRVLVYRDTVEPVYDPSYFIYSEDVEDCRKAMVNLGLYRMPPEPGDDPVILEVWL